MGKLKPQHLVQGAISLTRAYGALTTMVERMDAPAPTVAAPPPDPMAGFATGDELARYQMREGAFFLGRIHRDHGVNFGAGIHDDRHVFIIAGSRAGKGLTFGIPNALSWQGPLFAIDPKGEIASIVAMRRGTAEAAKGTGTSVRHFVGQDVAILDPLGQVTGPARAYRVNYNPLVDIDLNKGGGVLPIHSMASAIVKPDQGSGAHFSESAETLIAGLLEAVKTREPPERQTLPQMRSLLLAGFDVLREYMAEVETRAGLAQEAANLMEEVGGDEWGSFRTTLSRSVKWLAEPDMQDHLAASAFSLRRAAQTGGSIFVCLPPDQIPRFASWLRVIVQTVIDAKMAMGTNQKGPQMLCLLDEFPTLGHFKSIEDSAGYMAGYGLKLVPIIQNVGQIQALYAKNWETFLGNAGAIIAFALNTEGCEKYVANRLGRLLISETTHSTSAGTSAQFLGAAGVNSSSSSNTGRHERPVRFPNEVHEQGARETGRAFVLPASGRALTVERVSYTSFPVGTYDAPDFITEWESRNWRHGG